MRDYYDVLGVAPTASFEELRRAYRDRARLFHPDSPTRRPGDDDDEMQLVNEAWDVLGDPARRRAYDATRPGAPRATPDEDAGQILPQVPEGFIPAHLRGSTRFRVGQMFRNADARRRALSLIADSDDLSSLRALGPTEVWWLDLSKRRIVDDDLRFLRRFSALEVLFVTDTAVTDVGVGHLAGLSLRTFEAADCALTDQCLAALAAMPTLERLNLYGTAITDRGLGCFRGHAELAVLDVRRTRFDGDALPMLAALPSLRELRVDGASWFERRAFAAARPDVLLLP